MTFLAQDGTTILLVARTKKSLRGQSGFTGPDKYVAVVIIPPGVHWTESTPLNTRNAHRVGVEIRRYGEGYRIHSGPNSSLGRAMRAAREDVQRLLDEHKSKGGI